MISRGYFIGEIVDSLSNVSQQVETRCKLGLTDLNKYLEDFFLFILNQSLKLELTNCNNERSNAPGLDLIDKLSGIGFQITSVSTSDKINKTLEALSELEDRPKEIYVFIIGKAQGSYTLDEDLCNKMQFSKEENIWDINLLCKKLIELPIDTLQKIYEYVRKELARVKIELEIPNENGEYVTTIANYIESTQKPTLTDFSAYYNYQLEQCSSFELDLSEVQKDFSDLSLQLSRLPRITRDFFAFLLDRRDEGGIGGIGQQYFRFNHNRLKRVCRFPALDEEITLLSEHGFADLCEADDYDQSPYVRIFSKGKTGYFIFELVDFIEAKNIDFRKPIVNLDFSDFGENI